MEINRTLGFERIKYSIFLFGPRQSGKTWLLKNTVEYDLYIDLLNEKERQRYLKNPNILFDEVTEIDKQNAIIVIDEIQKVPNLLNEVHRAIESNKKPKFILTGSSTRKLKRGQANMLGGRAVTFRLFPFSFFETKERFSLNAFLQFGGIPNVFLAENDEEKKLLLESYVTTYLKEEVFDEALTRNLPAFSKFLDIAGFENGNIINYTTIAREIGTSSKTVKEYFNILTDTLIAFMLPPFVKSQRKRLISHPKFYFADIGIVFALKRMLSIELTEGSPIYGDSFEHFIILETIKAISYLHEEIEFSYFRTKDGAEVDLILEKHSEIVAIEIKSSEMPRKLSGLKSFLKDHSVKKAICVCRTPRAYSQNGIHFIPWKKYIELFYEKKMFE